MHGQSVWLSVSCDWLQQDGLPAGRKHRHTCAAWFWIFFDEVCLRVWSSNLVGSCIGHAFSHLRIRMLAMGGGSDDAICVFPVAVARGWLKALADVDPLVLWPSAINFLSVKVTEQSYDA